MKFTFDLPYAVLISSLVVSILFFAAPWHDAKASGFQVDSSGTLTTNLAAYYKLEDLTESFVGGGTKDLTNHSSVSFTTAGIVGNSADGGSGNANKYLDYSGNAGVTSGSYSMSVWVKLDDAMSTFVHDKEYVMASAGDSSSGIWYEVSLMNSSNGHKYLSASRNLNGSGGFVRYQDVVINTGTWYHIVYTYDGTNQSIWLNGSKVATSADSSSGAGANSGVSLFDETPIEASLWGEYLPGKLDEVGLWSKKLSDQEVADLYNSSTADTFLTGPHIVGGTLQQYESDATTTITQGSTVNGNKVVFGADLTSDATSTQLQVELATSTANFNGQVSASSSFVTSGNFATTSISSIANGSYYWRARAWDSQNSSTWQQIGASSSVDFVVSVSTSTLAFPFQIDRGGTLTTGLQSYYKLEDAGDAWGSAPLTNNSSVSFSTVGIVGNSADGGSGNTSNYLHYSGNVGVTSASSSISLWVNLDDAMSTFTQDKEYVLASAGDSSSGVWYEISLNNSSNGHKYLSASRNLNGSGGFVRDQDVVINTGTWYHIVYTYDGTTQSIYLDGVEEASSTDTSSGVGAASGISLFTESPIVSTWNKYLPAKVDEVGLWSKVLSDQEITDLYHATNGDPFSGLAQYYANGAAAIPRAGATAGNSVAFGSTLYPIGSSALRLQVEVQSTSTSFTNTSSTTSGSVVSSGTVATATISNLNPGEYHWQARVIDANNNSSTWQLFGVSTTSTDFIAKAEQSEYFDGSSSLSYSAASDTFAATNPFTIEFWYRTGAPTSSVIDFIDTRNDSSSNGFLINRDQDKGIHFLLKCDTSTLEFHMAKDLATNSVGAAGYDSGIWHQVVITKNSGTTADAIGAYFDDIPQFSSGGSLESNGPISGNCFTSSSANSIWFWRDSGSTSTPNSATGTLDEVRIWNNERSIGDVSSTWNKEVTSTANLLGLWHFNATSTDFATGHVTSSQRGNPTFSSSTPFGHFIYYNNQNNPGLYASVTSTVAGPRMLWRYDGSQNYLSEVQDSGEVWNSLGPVVVTSTGATTSTMTLQILDKDDSSGSSALWYQHPAIWVSQFATPTSTVDHLYLNGDYLNFGYCGFSCPDWRDTVIEHELGHALGLDHSYWGNVMYYTADPNHTRTTLGDQDKSDYHFIWGGN